MAPTAAMALNGTAVAGLIGRAVPLAFLIATVGVLFVSYGFIRLTRWFNSAGSVFALAGATLGPRAGFFAGLALMATYTLFTIASAAEVGLFGRLPRRHRRRERRLADPRADRDGRRGDPRVRRHPRSDAVAARDGGHLGAADPRPDGGDLRQGHRRLGAERPELHAGASSHRRAASRSRPSRSPPCSASCPSAASRARRRWRRKITGPRHAARDLHHVARRRHLLHRLHGRQEPRLRRSARPASSASAIIGAARRPRQGLLGSGFTDIIDSAPPSARSPPTLGAATAASRILFAISPDASKKAAGEHLDPFRRAGRRARR